MLYVFQILFFISPRGGTVVNPNIRISARVFVVPAGSSIPAAESWGSNSLLPRLSFFWFSFSIHFLVGCSLVLTDRRRLLSFLFLL